jgi:hypothetical protein
MSRAVLTLAYPSCLQTTWASTDHTTDHSYHRKNEYILRENPEEKTKYVNKPLLLVCSCRQ